MAAHLPRGTGPKDLEDVHTFSDLADLADLALMKSLMILDHWIIVEEFEQFPKILELAWQ